MITSKKQGGYQARQSLSGIFQRGRGRDIVEDVLDTGEMAEAPTEHQSSVLYSWR